MEREVPAPLRLQQVEEREEGGSAHVTRQEASNQARTMMTPNEKLEHWKDKYQYRFDYHKTHNWKKVRELQQLGRSPKAYVIHKGFYRQLFHIKVTLYGGTVLVVLILLKLGGY
jgi:RNA-splicing ligase RtcB